MLYSSVWTRVPGATAAVMIGWIVTCCTLASMRRITCPPRWIRPRIGGLSFSNVPRPGPACPGPARLPACDGVRAAPFGHFVRLPLVPGYHVNLVDLHLAFERHLRGLGGQAVAQLLRHGLHVRPAKAQLPGDLLVREVQAHKVEAQYPHPQRLVMPGQHRAGQIVKTSGARLAAIALPSLLGVVAPVPDHRGAAAPRATHALWPAALAHKGEALGVVHQAGKVDQVGCSHERQSSSDESGRSIIPPLSSPLKPFRTVSHSFASQHPGTQ